MANRLLHGRKAFVRRMQMSVAVVFVFVEGKDVDPNFYDKICAPFFETNGLRYEICKAEEVVSNHGGKKALLEFHAYLKRRGILDDIFQGKRTVAFFFFDKDIDDILRRRKRCPHVCYSRYYDVQNDLVRNSQLVRAIASATSVQESRVPGDFLNSSVWCGRASARWTDWVTLCVLSAKLYTNCGCGYSSPSPIQDLVTGLVDPIKLQSKKAAMAASLGVSIGYIEAKFIRLRKALVRMQASGSFDLVFKGKWYARLLEGDVVRSFGANAFVRDQLEARLDAAMVAGLDFAADWTEHYLVKLRSLLE